MRFAAMVLAGLTLANTSRAQPPPPRHDACALTNECRVEGLCATFERRCVASSDRHCSRSENCREEGRCTLDPEERECDDGLDRADAPMFVGGLVVIGHGAASITLGVALLFHGLFGIEEEEARYGAALMGIGGLLMLGLGTPLTAVGRCKVPRKRGVGLELRPGGVALVGSF